MGACLGGPDMNKQQEAQRKALGGSSNSTTAAARAGAGAALAGSILANVGAQAAAAAEQQKVAAWRLYRAGPELRADGKLVLGFVEELWAFSPAYPGYLLTIISQEQYWSVLRNINNIIGAARDGVSGDAAIGSASPSMQDHVAKAQAAAQAKEAAMIQVRQFLVLTNRESSALQWGLERAENATRHYVSGQNGLPGHYETRWHVKFTIEVTISGGSLPPSAVSSSLSVPPSLPSDALTEEAWAKMAHPPTPNAAPAPLPAFVEGMAKQQ